MITYWHLVFKDLNLFKFVEMVILPWNLHTATQRNKPLNYIQGNQTAKVLNSKFEPWHLALLFKNCGVITFGAVNHSCSFWWFFLFILYRTPHTITLTDNNKRGFVQPCQTWDVLFKWLLRLFTSAHKTDSVGKHDSSLLKTLQAKKMPFILKLKKKKTLAQSVTVKIINWPTAAKKLTQPS